MPPPAGIVVGGVMVVTTCGSVNLANGSIAVLAMDHTGALCTNASGGGGGGLSVVDQTTWIQGTSPFTPNGGVFNDTATLSSGQEGTARLTTKRAAVVDVDTSGNALYSAITAAVPWLATTAWNTNTYSNGTTNPGAADLHGNPWVDIGGVGGAALALGQTTKSASVPVTIASDQGATTVATAAADPCQGNVATIKSFSITTNTTTNIVTGTSAKKLYVCYLYMQTAAANNVAVISGTTGATCGANTAGLIGGLTAANGLNNAANSGQAIGNGGYSVLQVQTNNDDICIITSAATPLAGVIKYVVQ